MRQYKLDQLRVNNQTKLSDMAMQIKVSAMKLSRMKVELRNEHYLDSLGAGTTDKVRQAELSYNVAQLEYEQLQQQYKNEKEVAAAELKVQELDFNIFRKSLSEKKRTLDDAQIRSPRRAILTYINNQIGAQISEGEQVAIISDLSHFKVEGEIADTYGDRVAAGGKAIVKIGSDKLEAGQNVVFDVDVVGGCNIKKFYGDRALSVFIQPPSVEELRCRLEGRGTDAPEIIESRIAKAEYELGFAPQFDCVIVNDDLEAAKAEALKVIEEFLAEE